MKKIIFSIVLFFIAAGNVFGQVVTFQKTYGGPDFEEGKCVRQTIDGGYIITGSTTSFSVVYQDVYLIKTDSIGDTLWTKTFDRAGGDEGLAVQQTTDGGYIIAGYTYDFNAGGGDVYLIKTDTIGDTLWTRSFGGPFNADVGYSIRQTTDGGYIIAGVTRSIGAGNDDVYLIRTNANGDSLWTRSFGGALIDRGYSVQQTTDGGYIIAGNTNSFGAGDVDIYLLKTDSSGNILWTKTFGGTSVDYGNSVQQTTDGGYIIAGNNPNLIKTDANGDLLWTKTFDVGSSYEANSVQQTFDGGYIIVGSTSSETYLIKTDANGNLLWAKTFGGNSNEIGSSVHQTIDAGYIITGYTNSFGAGNTDIYLIKTDSLGNSGCNQANPAIVVSAPATQVSSPATISTALPVALINIPTTTVGSGGTITTLCSSVGIAPISNFQLPITISPNPTTNNFTITFPNTINKGVIEIYNVMGVPINIGINENVFNVSQKEVQLKNMEAGIYFVKVRDGEKEYCKKLVIE